MQYVKFKLLQFKKDLNKERYKEEYEEGSELLWPSDKEDKITRKFYKDLSHLSKKKISNNKNKSFNFINLIFSLINLKKF